MPSSPTVYNAMDRLKLLKAGLPFGSGVPRKLNLSNNFILTEDITNNKYDIDVSTGGGGGGTVTPSSTDTFTNKTIDYNLNTLLNQPSSSFTPSSTDTVTNKNLTSATNTFPSSLATLTGTQALTNKDLTSGTNTFPTSLATLTGSQALTNKDLTAGTNTFPTSLATLTGSQTLTNKDLTSGTNTFPTSLATLTGSQTLTNKTMDYNSNTFQNFPSGSASALPSVTGRYGVYQGYNATPIGDGLLRDLTLLGSTTTALTYISTLGPATTFTCSAALQSYGGFRSTNVVASRRFNPAITAKVQVDTNTTTRLKFGFASSTTLSDAMTTVLNNISGFMIGFGVNETTYSVATNNGGAAQTTTGTGVNVVTAASPVLFGLSINDSSGLVNWSVKTSTSAPTTGTISATLPTIDTTLYLFCTCQVGNTAAARTLTVEWTDMQLSDSNSF